MRPSDSEARERAARELEKSFMVTAGAGTGKTSLIIERILHHLLERGTPLERIAAITFTVKAAAELRERLEDSLERCLELAAGSTSPHGMSEEADRVFERLDAASRKKAAERSRAAIEAIDSASLTTIHSFASELLRRHHQEARVDVGFKVDEGSRAAELFDELWGQHLEEALGPGEVPAGWKALLRKLPVDEVERLARDLAVFKIPLEVVGSSAAEAQLAYAAIFARSRLGEVKRLQGAVSGVEGVNQGFVHTLDVLEELFTKLADGKKPSGDPESLGLPRSKNTVGKHAAVADPEELEKAQARLVLDARALLTEVDFELVTDLSHALHPFLVHFREESLRRGFVSYDGLMVLARDLLRDNISVRGAEGQRFAHILVDEFQDTDPLQYEIIFFLTEVARSGREGSAVEKDGLAVRLSPGKLFIVGDEKQSIYRFRGADLVAYRRAVEAVARQGGEVLALEANFRSVPELVEPLNGLFAAQFGAPRPSGCEATALDPAFRPITAQRGPSGSPSIEIWSVGKTEIKATSRRRAEAEVIATRLREWITEKGFAPKDAAILLYSLSDVDVLLRSLRAEGIPYVVEGGRGFYERYEVELLIQLLRVVASPADPIPLVACLRSPIAPVPDRELQLFARERRQARDGACWSLFAKPDSKKFPDLARALELLGGFARRHRDEPMDRMARKALEETPLRLAMAASYEGAQRVANLEKAVRKICALSMEGSLSGAEVLDRVEEEEAAERAQGDSPLADETLNAVRILSIHKAKGLEWPVVILPDLARDLKSSPKTAAAGVMTDPRDPFRAEGARLPPALAVSVGKLRTPAHLLHDQIEELQRAAEAKRLLYVAATRARDRLILVAGYPQRGRRTWIQALSAWGYEIAGHFPPGESFAKGAVLHRRVEAAKPSVSGKEGENPDPRVIEAARAYEKALRKVSEAKPRRILSPSSEQEDRVAGDLGGEIVETSVGERQGDRETAMAAGTATHLLLELWDGKDPAWLLQNAARAARAAAGRAGTKVDEVLARVREILEDVEDNGRIAELLREKPMAREMPILYEDQNGDIWDGTMDLVTGTPEAPRIVDYKTDAGSSREELQLLYAGQLARYSEGLQLALGLKAPPPARIELLRKVEKVNRTRG